MIFNSGTVVWFPGFSIKTFASGLLFFFSMLSLSREISICLLSWRTHKDTAHAKAAKWMDVLMKDDTCVHSSFFIEIYKLKPCQNKAWSMTQTFPKILLSMFHWTILVQWNMLKLFVKSKCISSSVFISDVCTEVLIYWPFCWLNNLFFTTWFDGL